MDPLSVASGIVGIVAFAFQLAKTASKVKRALEEVKSAPKEAKKLLERMVMLETICQLIGFHLERRETLPNYPLSPALDIMSTTLAQCLVKAQELEQVLSNLGVSNGSTQIPRSKFNATFRLRLVLRRDEISSLVREIDNLISDLKFVIQMDLWALTSIRPHLPSLSNSCVELVEDTSKLTTTSSVVLQDSGPPQYTVARKARRAMNEQHRVFRYVGYITWAVTDGWIGDEENDNFGRTAYRKGCISFQLPCTSMEFKFCYDGGMGTPLYALNVKHIIQCHSELGIQLLRLMAPGVEAEELHKLVSRRQLSIYSVLRKDDQETDLFFLAICAKWAEGCRYLLQQDFRHEFTEASIPVPFLGRLTLPISLDAFAAAEIFLSTRAQDTLEADIKFLLKVGSHPDYFIWYLNMFFKSTVSYDAEFLPHAWNRLVANVFCFGAVSDWIPAFRCLIDRGADIHQPCGPQKTAYMKILCGADHPFEADDRSHSWLELLKACDVDLATYVESEVTIIKTFGYLLEPNVRRKQMYILYWDGLPIPSWRWELPSETKINEALGEFLHLGIEFRQHGPGPIRLRLLVDFHRWKLEEAYTDWADYCFPFLLSPIDVVWGADDQGADDQLADERWRRLVCSRAIEIRDKRIAQREAKRWRKAHPREKQPWKKMPGAWRD